MSANSSGSSKRGLPQQSETESDRTDEGDIAEEEESLTDNSPVPENSRRDVRLAWVVASKTKDQRGNAVANRHKNSRGARGRKP